MTDLSAAQLPQPIPGLAQLTLQGQYDALTVYRQPFLARAQDTSALSIPSLIPPPGHSPGKTFATPFQSSGSRGTINLAAKLLLSLFPPNTPFFKFQVDPFALKMVSGGDEEIRDEIETKLTESEEAVLREIETKGYRPRLHEAIKHLLVAGNCVLYMGEKGRRPGRDYNPRVYHLPSYVVRRCNDNLDLLILRETIAYEYLPESIRNHRNGNVVDPKAPVDLYTGCFYDEDSGRWKVYQEAMGLKIDGTEITYTEEFFPFIVLRGEFVSGEDYGRSYAEYHLGDLQSLEGLAQALMEGAAAACALKFLVDPNGLTDEKDLNDKPNGAFVPGREQDVHVLQLNKFADFQVAANTANTLREDLARSFLSNSSIQRNGERVTAEEIRYMAQELEQVLGGIYSLLSTEFQLPFVRVLVARMKKEKRLPKMPSKLVSPTVVTGIEALGRGNDLNRLMSGLNVLKQYLGDAVTGLLNNDVLATRVLNATGTRDEGLVKTEEQRAAEAQQAQQQAMVEHLGPNAVTQMGGALQSGMAAQMAQQAPS